MISKGKSMFFITSYNNFSMELNVQLGGLV